MGVSFIMMAWRVDERGEILVDRVDYPSYSVRESLHLHLLNQRDRFGSLFDGLDMRWYDQTSVRTAPGEQYQLKRADCFNPAQILSCLDTILERLPVDDARMPRLYKIRRLQPTAMWVSEEQIYYDGRVMSVTAGWNQCEVIWATPRTTDEYFERFAATGNPDPWDLRIDLRDKSQFECHDVAQTPDGPAQGKPLTLLVASDSPEAQYRATLEEMRAFCRAVNPQKYCVFTMRG